MTISVLVCEPMAPLGLKKLESHPDLKVLVALNLSRDELMKKIGNVDALLVRSQTKVDQELIDKGLKLKLIGRAGVGIDNIDIVAAKNRGVAVINTPSGNSISAAELAFALMLCLSRHIVSANDRLKNKSWERKEFLGTELYGKTLGLIGFGNVGQNLAERARAFYMRVIAYDPLVNPSLFNDLGVKSLPLNDVLANADFLSLHCALTEDSKNLINGERIKLMKRGAMLINTARGELIDDKAVIKSLDEGHLKAAALDVFRKEPPDMSDPILSNPKIIVTPHLGASTEEAQLRVSTLLAEQTIAFFNGDANITRIV